MIIDLSGKVALVTGASRGIGKADALALGRAGADVVIGDVEDAEATAEEIRALGRKAAAFKMDVTSREQVNAVVAKIKEQFGGLHIVVNNAALLDNVATLARSSDAGWDRHVSVNLTGCYNVTKAAWPLMVEQKWGRVVFMSSVAGLMGDYGHASYAATKAGLIGLAKSLALEGARHGITSNAVAGGLIGSEVVQFFMPEENKQRILAKTAMKRMGTPEDIASAIVFFCSEQANYITGQVLVVGGGVDLFVF